MQRNKKDLRFKCEEFQGGFQGELGSNLTGKSRERSPIVQDFETPVEHCGRIVAHLGAELRHKNSFE